MHAAIHSIVLAATLFSSSAMAQTAAETMIITGPDALNHVVQVTDYSGYASSTGFGYNYEISVDDTNYDLAITGTAPNADFASVAISLYTEDGDLLTDMTVWDDATLDEGGYDYTQWVPWNTDYNEAASVLPGYIEPGVSLNDNMIQALGAHGLILVDPAFVQHLIVMVAQDTNDYWLDYANWPDADLGLTACLSLQETSNYWWSRWECPRVAYAYGLRPADQDESGHNTVLEPVKTKTKTKQQQKSNAPKADKK